MKSKIAIIIILSGLLIAGETGYADPGPPANNPPVAVLTADREITLVDNNIVFDGSTSSDSDGTITKYEWNFDDGSNNYYETSTHHPDGAFDGITTHTYDSSGTYTVTLKVTDDDSDFDTDTFTIKIANTIQGAIDVSSNGNTIVIDPGTYNESIDFDGKVITLTGTNPDDWDVVAATIINANGASNYAVIFDCDSELSGFTVTGATNYAGISCESGTPTIKRCIVKANTGANGHGIYCGSSGSAIIVNNKICNNAGSGIEIAANRTPDIKNNWIYDNDGHGIHVVDASSAPVIRNNTIVYHNGSGDCGIKVDAGSLSVSNCILWDNDDDLSGCTATYSRLDGGTGNNTSSNPLFVDAGNDDYHLSVSSLCVDAGAAGDYSGEFDIDGGSRKTRGVDMGADEISIWFVDEDATGGGNNSKGWANAYIDLQNALANANASEEIWVAEGTYEPTDGSSRSASFVLVEGVVVYGGFDGTETSRDQRDWKTNETILSGDLDDDGLYNDNSYHVVTGADNATIDGFTITGGNADGSGGADSGGGIYCSYVDGVTIKNCQISENRCEGTYESRSAGGGVYCYIGSLNIINCSIIDNDADHGGGIGIWKCNTKTSSSIINCVISGNAVSADGGGIYNKNSKPTIVNCTFSGNTAGDGGGIANAINSDSVITNCVVWNNSATGQGDEIFNHSAGDNPNISYSCIQGSGGSTSWDTNLGTDGGGNVDGDPYFADSTTPAGQDGIFGTLDDGLRLTLDSSCIDAANGSAALLTDILGFGHVDVDEVDNTGTGTPDYADIGAYEAVPVWYVNCNVQGGSGDGTSWANAFTDLQDALAGAASGSKIWVAAGTYTPGISQSDSFQLVSDVEIYGGFDGTETSKDQRDWVTNVTVLSGDIDQDDLSGLDPDGRGRGLPRGNNSYHVIKGSDNAVLDGFTIAGGHANGSGSDDNGGGIYCDGVSPKIVNCIITCNKSAGDGAGMYNDNSASPTLINCIISGNLARASGAGIYNKNSSSPIITNCTFNANKAFGEGGGICSEAGTSCAPTITNCVLWKNIDGVDSEDESAQITGPVNSVTYSCIQDDDPGDTYIPFGGSANNNIDDDPKFDLYGQWDWRKPDGTNFSQTLPLDDADYTIFDLPHTNQDYQLLITSDLPDSGIVENYLVNKLPVYADGTTGTTSNVNNFNLWFAQDPIANGIPNSNIQVDYDRIGIYSLDQPAFFPIDFVKNVPGYPDQYYTLPSSIDPCQYPHNYHFTFQYHVKAKYYPGQTFTFESADDLFVFIDDQLEVDHEGIYQFSTLTTILDMDTLNDSRPIEQKLKEGDEFDFDLYFAQRHVGNSTLIIEIPVQMEPYYIAGDYQLDSTSPCIDAGDNSAIDSDITRDVACMLRLFENTTEPGGVNGAVVDMGAYEYQFQVAPVASDDTYSMYNYQTLTVDAASGLLANDTDRNLDELVVDLPLISDTPYGTLNVNSNGSFDYTPVEGFNGDVSFTYKAYDDQEYSNQATATITVNAITVDAGEDQTLELPIPPTTDYDLDGTITDDGQSNPTITWSIISAPFTGDLQIDNPSSEDTTVSFNNAAIGRYILKFQASYNSGSYVVSDTMAIFVEREPGSNGTPYVNADQYDDITLPNNTLTLNGIATDDGIPDPPRTLSVQWSFESSSTGGTAEFSNYRIRNPIVTFSQAGEYVLMLTAGDGEKSSSSKAFITVNPEPGTSNQPPTVEAGGDKILNSTGEFDFAGLSPQPSVNDPDSSPVISWTVRSGPPSGVIFNDTSAVQPIVIFTEPDTYVLRLTADDGANPPVSDEVEIVVNAPPYNDFAIEAGDDQVIILPAVASLQGGIEPVGLDPANVIQEWHKDSGPGDVEFTDNSSLTTQARFSKPGEYLLELEGKYSGLTRTDQVTIKVRPGTIISGGEDHTLVVDDTEDKGVWSCGLDSFWLLPEGWEPDDRIFYQGVLGTGDHLYGEYQETLPVHVLSGDQGAHTYLKDIETVSAGWRHSLALDYSGNIWAWGFELYGQLGNGINGPEETSSCAPVKVLAPDLDFDDNPDDLDYDGVGVDDIDGLPDYLSNIINIAAGRSGEHSLAVDVDGYVFAWGKNNIGQIGIGEDIYYRSTPPIPYRVFSGEQNDDPGKPGTDPLKNIIAVSGGAHHSMALEKIDQDNGAYGKVFTFGENLFSFATSDPSFTGKLGTNDSLSAYKAEPVIVHAGEQDSDYDPASPTFLENIVAISAGWHHSMALEKLDDADPSYNGRVYTWGWNYTGWFGNVSPGYIFTRRDCDGGRLGNGSDGSVVKCEPMPILVVGPDLDNDGVHDPEEGDLEDIIEISAGESHCMALNKNGNVWTWGDNKFGQLGNNTDVDSLFPVKVVAPDRDNNGEPDDLNGDGDNTNDFLGDDVDIIAISSGYWHCLAMDANGAIYSWGDQEYGRLGIGVVQDNQKIPQVLQPLGARIKNLNTDQWYSTIQSAIDDAGNDHEIVVYPGRYREAIDFGGKDIILRSVDPQDMNIVANTIIDGTDLGGIDGTVKMKGDSYDVCLGTLSGFTITNGDECGVYCFKSSPMIINNIISNNGDYGIKCVNPVYSPRIINNLIFENGGNYSSGAGICIGRVDDEGSKLNEVIIRNNTIVDNAVYGILFSYSSSSKSEIRNCIIWNNGSSNASGDNLYNYVGTVKYCCVGGGFTGSTNIASDPEFVQDRFLHDNNTPGDTSDDFWVPGDYHLQGESPCIDNGFFDNTIQSGINVSTITVADGSMYQPGGVIEIGNDGIARIIQTVDVDSITFGPEADSTPSSGDIVTDWFGVAMFEDYVYDNYSTNQVIEVGNVEEFHINDTVEIDGEYRIITDVDPANDQITLNQALQEAPGHTTDITFWRLLSLADERDIDGGYRVIGGSIDIGCDEVMPYTVDAGQYKVVTITEQAHMSDATVEYNGPAGSAGSFNVQWEVIDKPAGSTVTFENNNYTLLNPKVSFDQVGTYLLALSVEISGSLVGRDMVTVKVEADVDANVNAPYEATLFYDAVNDEVKAEVSLLGHIIGAEPADNISWIAPHYSVSLKDLSNSGADPISSSVTATFTKPGIFEMILEVADDSSGRVIGSDSALVKINHPFVEVIAGNNREVFLSGSEVTVDLSGYVEGVVPAEVIWEHADDAPVTLGSPTELSTTATFTDYGEYHFNLVAKDDSSNVIGTGTVIITVSPVQLTVDISTDDDNNAIDLDDTINLTGTVTGGEPYETEWLFMGIGATVTFGNSSYRSTWAKFSDNGIYNIVFVAKDANGSVLAFNTVVITVGTGGGYRQAGINANGPYSASPDTPLTLAGEALTDYSEYIDYVRWEFSGTSEYMEFVTSNEGWSTTVEFFVPGDYKVGLKGYDQFGDLIAMDIADVTVEEVVVDAGSDQAVTLESSEVTVDLEDGDISFGSPEWWVSAPDIVRIDNATSLTNAKATFTNPGQYAIHLLAKNSKGRVIGDKSVVITVNLPDVVVSTGKRQDLVLPVTINNGEVSTNILAEIRGILPAESTAAWESDPENPDTPVIVQNDPPYNTTATVTFDTEGDYTLIYKVKNSSSEVIASGSVDVSVKKNTEPQIYPGTDRRVKLLDGSYVFELDSWVKDYDLPNPPDLLTVAWTVVGSPATAPSFNNAQSETPTVTFTAADIYKLRLDASDGDLSSWDTVEIEVLPESSEIEKGIYFGQYDPIELCSCDGSTTKPAILVLDDMMVTGIPSDATYTWSVLQGPSPAAQVTFIPSTSAVAPVMEFDTEGNYQLQLEVKDSSQQPLVDPKILWVTVDLPIPLSADLDSPTVNIIDPTNGANVLGLIDVEVDIEDTGSGIAEVELEIGGQTIKSVNTGFNYPEQLTVNHSFYSYSLDPQDNPHTLTVYATDRCGNSSVSSVNINVISPSGNELFAAITNVVHEKNINFKGGQTLPIIKKGLFDLEGTAYSDSDIEYKIGLFKYEIGTYATRYWYDDELEIYWNYFVKDLTDWQLGSITQSNLGTLDFSGVENGTYQLLLTVRWPNDQDPANYIHDNVAFVLDCPLKIGNVKFSQEDMVVPVGGYPLRVIRTYDSLRKDSDGTFGYGWMHSFASMDIELPEERALYTSDEFLDPYGDGTQWMVRMSSNYGRDVILTMPDGQRVTFQFTLNKVSCEYGSVSCYEAKYISSPGINATLEALDDNGDLAIMSLSARSSLLWAGQENGQGGINLDAAYYDFAKFRLTTEDGTQYEFERDDYGRYGDFRDEFDNTCYARPRGKPYLSKIITTSGDVIKFNVTNKSSDHPVADSVEYLQKGTNKAAEIFIDREDSSGRIEAIRLPNSSKPSLKYDYDVHGNLEKVHRLVNDSGQSPDEQYETTTYSYNYNDGTVVLGPQEHYIADIKDERGITPIKYMYDDDGRMIGVYDAKGGYIEINHDLTNKTETVTDRNGNITIYDYDERGRVVSTTNADGTTLYTYENYTLQYEVGGTTYYGETYDNDYSDKPCVVEDPAGNKTYNQYDSAGRTIRTCDSEINITENEYDEIGNLIKTKQWRLDDLGDTDLVFPDDYAEVSQTVNKYWYRNTSGTLITADDPGRTPDDQPTNLFWRTEVAVDFGDSSADEITEYSYDSLNRLETITKLDSAGGSDIITTYVYDQSQSNSHDQPYKISEPYYSGDSPVYIRHFEYDDKGNQIESWYDWTDPAGSGDTATIKTVTDYDDVGRVLQTRRVVTVTNNPTGTMQNSDTVLSQTVYNAIGKVDYTINENNIKTAYYYDATGNLVQTSTFEYIEDPQNPSTYIWFELTTAQTLYDAEGRVLVSVGQFDATSFNPTDSATWPNGTENVYDPLGRVIETRRWEKVKLDITDLVVDEEVVGKTVNPNASPRNAWGTYAGDTGDPTPGLYIGWSSNGNLPVVLSSVTTGQIGPLSYTKTIYDVAGRVKHSVALDEAGFEQVTTYEYDYAGKQIAMIDPLGHYLDDQPNNNNLYVPGIALHDGTINATKINFGNFNYNVYHEVTDLDGNFTGEHRTETYYIGTRRSYVVDAREFEDGAVQYDYTTFFDYDDLGRVTTTTHPPTDYIDEEGIPVTGADIYTHVSYDGLGRKKYATAQVSFDAMPDEGTDDFKYNVKQFSYDVSGRLTEVTLPEPKLGDGQPEYRYIYDDYGNQAGILDPKLRLTVFAYNELNQQVGKYMPFVPTDPLPADIDTAAEVYDAIPTGQLYEQRQYDELGRVKVHIDFKEQATGYFYNDNGQLAYKLYYDADGTADGFNDNYKADLLLGDDVEQYTAWSRKINYTYDNLGRKDQVIVDSTVEQDFDYDTEGRILSITTPEGDIGYGYNSVTGRKELVRTPDTDDWAGVDTQIAYVYDKGGSLSDVIVEKRNGVDLTDNDPVGEQEITSYEYTPVGSIDMVYRNVDGTDIITTDYDYDALNRAASVTNKDSSSATLSSYSYDYYADGMRQSVTEADSSGTTAVINFSYDNLNRLTQENYDDHLGSDDYIDNFVYDLVGNRFSYSKDGTMAYYFYNEIDQLEKESPNPDGSSPDVVYGYDYNGSLTSKAITAGDTTDYTYNLRNRLETVTVGSDPTITYTYDPDGVRTSKDNGTTATNYLIDPFNPTGYAQVLKQTQAGSDDITYIAGLDILAQATGANNPKYLLYDGHGSARLLSDNNGDLISGQTFNYDAYGNRLDSSSEQTNLLYAGEMYDSDLGWYYNRARYYRPAVGLFNRMDDYPGNTQNPLSLHKYLYGHNNPVNNIDPTGQFIGGLGGFVMSVAIQSILQGIYIGSYTYAMAPSAERIYGHASDLNFHVKEKEHANATIIVHGIAPRLNGWSSNFIDELETRANNQDYYEFTWSGYTLTGTVGINKGVHDVATNSLVRAVQILQQKGYSKVNIVSHSWGTVLSRDAQYAGVGNINTWATMGSPLNADTAKPAGLSTWMNFYSMDDWVVTDAPDYLGMTGVDAGTGYLYNNPNVNISQGVGGGHRSYWTNPTVLDMIGNRLGSQR